MKAFSLSKNYISLGVFLSLTATVPVRAAEQCSTLFDSAPVATQAPAVNPLILAGLVKQQLQAQLVGYLSSIVPGISMADVAAKRISPMAVKDLGQTGTVPDEMAILAEFAKRSNEGTLRPAIQELFAKIQAQPNLMGKPNPLKGMPPEKSAYAIETVVSNVEGLLALRGMTKVSALVKYQEWPVLAQAMESRLKYSPKGLDHILHFSKSRFAQASEIKLLVDGEQSFAMRDSLMSSAQKSIDVLSWAIYSDKTGFEAADLLIQKQQAGVKVRVMVDGQVAAKPGYNEAVQKLEQAGVEVIRWTSSSHIFQGQHRKMLIIDGEHMIAGGLNFGDVYSHKNPDPAVPRWRDTDIYVRGDAVNDGNRLFADLWNQQVTEKKLKFAKITTLKPVKEVAGEEGVAILTHDPSKDTSGSTVLMTLLKGIREAKQSLDIENAYVILNPSLKAEIQAAIKRGVKVRVLTNSDKSVDEAIVSTPIMRSAYELSQMGAEVYLKQGATLHSKLAIIDNQYTMVMSYNLHPRSERVEGEMAVVVKSQRFAQNVSQTFAADIQGDKAQKISADQQITLPDSPLVLPALRIFFDML